MYLNYIKIILLWCFLTVSCFAQNYQTDDNSIQWAQENKLLGIYWQNVQPSRALYYFKKSLDVYRKASNMEEVVHLNFMIAMTYRSMGESDNELLHLKKSLQDVLELDNITLEITILHELAKTYFSLHHYEMAEECVSIALQDSHNHDCWMLDEIMITQAEIELRKGNHKTSIELCKDVLARAFEKDDSDHFRTLQLMTAQDFAIGNFANAFGKQRQLERLTVKNHSLEQICENLDKALQAEMQHLKTKQSYIQPTYNEQKDQIAKMKRMLIVLVIVVCGEGLFLVWFIRFFKRLKTKKVRFTDEHIVTFEKKSKLSEKCQVLMQKKESLQETHDSLIASNQTKTKLFKDMSHDLHTPLIHLKKNLTNLMEDISEDQFRQAAAGLTDMVGDMSLLLENLLQWSKCQAQGIYAKPKYVEVTTLINDAIAQQKFSAAEKKITVFNALKHQLLLYVDEEAVKILLKTILQNSIKLSNPDATIFLTGDKNKQEGWLQIGYTGQMPLKQMFLQQSQTDDYGTESTELGKAISVGWMLCRALTKANNSDIRIEDEDVSAGSFNIFLCFPLEDSVK